MQKSLLSNLDKESGVVLGQALGISERRILLLGLGDLTEPLLKMLLLSGARVCASRLNAETLKKNENEYAPLARSREHFITCPADVSVESDIETLVSTAVAGLGGIDTVVFAVGAVKPGANVAHGESVAKLDVSRMLDQFDADALGAVRLARAIEPHLRSSFENDRVITKFIMMGSIGPGANGSSCQSASFGYNFAKGAVKDFAQMLARDWAGFCRINVVSPGPIITKLNAARMSPETLRGKTALEHTPTKDLCSKEDPAGSFYFLVSNLSNGMVAQDLVVDNGLTKVAPY